MVTVHHDSVSQSKLILGFYPLNWPFPVTNARIRLIELLKY